MQKITKYKADDGKEFYSEDECLQYETLCARIAHFVHMLPPVPDHEDYNETSFGNGGGYIQHDSAVFETVRVGLLNIANGLYPCGAFTQALQRPDLSGGVVLRIMHDTMPHPLVHAWGRITNTDKLLREWGQRFYTVNPHEGVMKQLNP